MNRRNFLRTKAAIASIPLIGLSGCLAEAESALSGDMSADGIFESLNGARKIGDSVSIDRGEISVTEAGSLKRFTYNTDSVGELIAPDGGIFRFFKIKFENFDIEEKRAPSFTTSKGRYENFGENVEYLLGGYSTEIAVFNDGEPALIPDGYSSYPNYSPISYTFGNPSIVGYPDNWNIRPKVQPNSILEGWIWGMTYNTGAVDCRIYYENNVYTWKPTEAELDKAPLGEYEVSI
jgi:hypothetical protein